MRPLETAAPGVLASEVELDRWRWVSDPEPISGDLCGPDCPLYSAHSGAGALFSMNGGSVLYLSLNILNIASWWGGTSCKEPICKCRRCKIRGFGAWGRKIPWRGKWQPTPVFLPGESHGQKGLVGNSLRGCKESDISGHLAHLNISKIFGNLASSKIGISNQQGEIWLIQISTSLFRRKGSFLFMKCSIFGGLPWWLSW